MSGNQDYTFRPTFSPTTVQRQKQWGIDYHMGTVLTTLPGFNFEHCTRPQGRNLAALKEIIFLSQHRFMDDPSQADVSNGVVALFLHACMTRSKFSDLGDRIWEAIWKTGEWYQPTQRPHLPNVDARAIQWAIKLYATGFEDGQKPNGLVCLSTVANNENMVLLNVFVTVMKWLGLQEEYHMTMIMTHQNNKPKETSVDSRPHKRRRVMEIPEGDSNEEPKDDRYEEIRQESARWLTGMCKAEAQRDELVRNLDTTTIELEKIKVERDQMRAELQELKSKIGDLYRTTRPEDDNAIPKETDENAGNAG
ncbi:hypothetical protein M434DRAFT_15042 [Hypoxylon sp. CO27-5]|nr:hypothetical protein M434DRAFT_15042 [Hypoxylon sp. CO27-5]